MQDVFHILLEVELDQSTVEDVATGAGVVLVAFRPSRVVLLLPTSDAVLVIAAPVDDEFKLSDVNELEKGSSVALLSDPVDEALAAVVPFASCAVGTEVAVTVLFDDRRGTPSNVIVEWKGRVVISSVRVTPLTTVVSGLPDIKAPEVKLLVLLMNGGLLVKFEPLMLVAAVMGGPCCVVLFDHSSEVLAGLPVPSDVLLSPSAVDMRPASVTDVELPIEVELGTDESVAFAMLGCTEVGSA